jgi:hypothetical protein
VPSAASDTPVCTLFATSAAARGACLLLWGENFARNTVWSCPSNRDTCFPSGTDQTTAPPRLPSLSAATSQRLSGEKSIAGGVGKLPGLVPRTFSKRPSAFHSRTLRSFDDVAIQRPSGEHATSYTSFVCPVSVAIVFHEPSACRSHNRPVSSNEPETSRYCRLSLRGCEFITACPGCLCRVALKGLA